MTRKKLVVGFKLLGIIALSQRLPAQDATQAARTDETTSLQTRVAGEQYHASGFHRFFLGAHYRKEWTTPVPVPTLDLGSFAGGLKATEKGGGKQTKSLRLEGANGIEYAFRSLDKDPSKTLPPELQESIAADVVQDQISTAHPYSALVVPPLAEAVGVLHVAPQLVIMPDDERLGPFREEFAGLFGMIEERPKDGPQGTAGFAGSKKIVGTDDLLKELDDDLDDHVDQKAYLKARLLDIYLGDWDRHFDQWRWARFEKEKGAKIWQPIPRDRDQAFAKFDGLFPALAEKRYGVIQFEGFNKDKPDVLSLTYSGRHMDRMFLNALTREDFQQASAEFVQQLTDEVIEEAVRQLPASIYEISGAWLEQKLKDRRRLMSQAADKFYERYASHVEITGRNKAEYFEINRADNDHVEVRIFKRDKDTGEKKGEALYFRKCNRRETEEIRLYLLGGDDKVVITGPAERSILLRVVSGLGNDELIDEAKGKTIFYDVAANSRLVKGSHMVSKSVASDSGIIVHEYQPRIESHGSLVKPVPYFAYNSDDGIFLGAGVSIYQFGFRKMPYDSKTLVRANYAVLTGAFRVGFGGNYIQKIYGMSLGLDAAIFAPRVRNFYGLGNQTSRDADREKNDYYRVKIREYLVRPILSTDLSSRVNFYFGAGYKHVRTLEEDNDGRFILEDANKPYGTELTDLLELLAGFTFDFRDNPLVPTKGAFLGTGIAHFPKVFENDSAFTKGFADARLYLSPFQAMVIGASIKGEKIWGAFPYYEAAYLGGLGSLRGFSRERFAGEAAVTGAVGFWMKLFRYNFLFPTDFGVFGVTDAGRVWLEGESTGDWHTSAGGGVWIAPVYRTLAFSVGAASSVEGLRVSLGGGLRF